MAKLYFKYGTMNSGKSTELIGRAYNFSSQKIPYFVLKSAIDTRDESVIHSRPVGSIDCKLIEHDDTVILNEEELSGIKWILVDEAQFLTPEQVDRLGEIVDKYNVNILCYGLRTDFQTKLFPGSKRLFEIADKIEEIVCTCACGNKNIFNARIDKDGNILSRGRQVEIGAEERYKAMCRKCYNEKIK